VTVDEVINELAALGTEKNRGIYQRHGAKEPIFGVSYADLGKLAKRIKVDQPLAEALWAAGNHDARVLGLQITDPAAVAAQVADAWMADCDNYVLADALAGVVARSPVGEARAIAWRDRPDEWPASAGWATTTRLVSSGVIDDASCSVLVDQIVREIHARPNRVRHEMVMTLIAIGARGDATLKQRVLDADRAIGKLAVDHGQTGCKTPAIGPYIAKIEARNAKRGG
jgi:DNA alkylation repair enzyme